ncbi:hypothetical protein HK096_005300 [Nowakowskiella sp. JEL0078]|nr:hypothetical protein HK096_005300 [Nowakowskiella sp. JEL0078]
MSPQPPSFMYPDHLLFNNLQSNLSQLNTISYSHLSSATTTTMNSSASIGESGVGGANGSFGRRDTVALKQSLADVLGEKAAAYWDLFKGFLKGNIVRREFDAFFEDNFAESGGIVASLHNDLLMAILSNCRLDVPPPSGPRSTEFTPKKSHQLSNGLNIPVRPGFYGQKRRAEDDMIPAELRKRNKFRSITGLEKDERNRLRILQKQQQSEPHSQSQIPPSQQPMPPFSTLVVPPNIDLDSIPASCIQLEDLPSREQIKAQMKFHSAISGMPQDPAEKCHDLMILALNSHVKSILSSNLDKSRSHSISNFIPQLSHLNDSLQTQTDPYPFAPTVPTVPPSPDKKPKSKLPTTSTPTTLMTDLPPLLPPPPQLQSTDLTNCVAETLPPRTNYVAAEDLAFTLEMAPHLVRGWAALRHRERVTTLLEME